MSARRNLCILLLLTALLGGCAPPKPGPVNSQTASADGGKAAPAATEPATNVAPAHTEAAPQPKKGPGSYDLAEPANGLSGLTRYRATLRLAFQGTQAGQPYQVEKGFDQVVDRELGLRFLTQQVVAPSGKSLQRFSGQLGDLRYLQAAPDQPCTAGPISAQQEEPFDPARLLPHFLGAEEAGQEDLNGTATRVYSFGQAAIGAGEQDEAAGKVWVAQDGGWIVRYELRLKSDQAFGKEITGEQRWTYEVSQVGTAEAELPAACLPVLADFPVPEAATAIIRMPGSLVYKAGMQVEELGAFYLEQLTGLGWTQQGEPLQNPGGMRWLFSRLDGEMEWIVLITARPDGDALKVRVYRLQTEAVPAQ